jgi:hypothetical protein
MQNDGDQELIALIAREQRGFRFVMYFGVAVLIAMALMSAGLGLYYRQAQEEIQSAVAHQQFDARRERQSQANQITNQSIHIRRVSDELRNLGRADVDAANTGDAITAARNYLERAQLGLASERLIEAASRAPSAQGAQLAVLEGVANLVAFDRSGQAVQSGDEALPQRLQNARRAFESARGDAVLGPLAQAGLASVLNFEAQRVSYTEQSCEDLFSAAAASAPAGGVLAPRPLFWRANCERKLGRTGDALRDYAAMLTQSVAAARNPSADFADLELAMNAFHGVGTTLIALHGSSDPNMQAGLEVAQRECASDQQAGTSPEMRLAIACLTQAMDLRRRMGQNASQVAGGTGENLGFAYLRDEDFTGALGHANTIAQDSLSPWNELVRAIAAEHVRASGGDAAAEARAHAREARRNISFFTPAQFDLCEVRRLLNAGLYEEAVAIVREEHRGADMPVCEG